MLQAYTGKSVEIEGFVDPVIIDIKGATFDKSVTPVLGDHDTALRIGHTIEQTIVPHGALATLGGRSIKGPAIAAVGIRSSRMRIAAGIMQDMKGGFPFQVSVGARIKKGYFLEEGEKAKINGRTWEGPLVVAQESVIRELTICVLGADNDTNVSIAARSSNKERGSMNFSAYLKSLGIDRAKLSDAELKAYKIAFKAQAKGSTTTVVKDRKPIRATERPDRDPPEERRRTKKVNAGANRRQFLNDSRDVLATEEERVDGIRAVARQFKRVAKLSIGGKELNMSQAKSKAIKEGWDANRFELECRRADIEADEPDGPAIHSKDKNINAKALEVSILRQTQAIPDGSVKNDKTGKRYGLEDLYKEDVLEASHDPKYDMGGSINELLALQIRATGRNPSRLRGWALMQEAYRAWNVVNASGFSTLNVTNILENVMNKAAYAGFNGVETVWQQICGRRPVNDFKPHALYRLDFDGSYKKVAADGELKHISMTDSKKTIQADTYGAMIAIDRKTQKNDDLGLIVDKARQIGRLGAERIEESVFVLLLSNPSSFFSVGNDNLISGGASALGLASMSSARKKYRDQVINGKPITVTPRILLCGTDLEDTANRLYRESNFAVTTTADTPAFTNNPHKGLYRPLISGYLNNTDILDQDGAAISGQSATQWYLLGDPSAPQGAALVIAFMDGREIPFFDEAQTAFNIPGGIQMRSYLDWGVAMHVTQMAVKSAGA
jgi:hypothetical protein